MVNQIDKSISPHISQTHTSEDLKTQFRIHTAQLLKANEQLQREINERKRAEQITRTLFRISNSINTSKNLDELYVSIHQALGEIIDLTNFYIALFYKETKQIFFPYFKDTYDSDFQSPELFQENNSLTGEVILTRKPLFLKEKDLNERAAENRIIGTTPKIWIGVPLIIKDEVIGVLAVQSYDDPNHFDYMDLDILISVSDQIALAIERKRSEQALKKSEEKYRTILNSIEDAYCEVDLSGNFTMVNDTLCRMLGYSKEQCLGMNNREYMSVEMARNIYKTFNKVYRTGEPAKAMDHELIHKNGNVLYVEAMVSLIRNNRGLPIGFREISRDITERKIAQKEHQILKARLQQSQRLEALGTLAGGIAHDFNNLLMGIQGRTSIILNNLEQSHPQYRHLKHIENYIQSASTLTNRLLGFARGGKYKVHPINLNELIEKNIQMFGRTKKEITITQKLAPNLKAVEVDTGQIEQVLLNLFVNAWQAMPGGGTIDIKTENLLLNDEKAQFYGLGKGEYIRLGVVDTGLGMDKETLTKIFDPFFTTKSPGHGTGLGLAMVYGIIKNHLGAIHVESEPGHGTSFTIFLPATNKAIQQKVQMETVPPPEGTQTILIVDDEKMILDVSRDILESLGYTIITADSGMEAIRLYQEKMRDIDLVILDMIMPKMGGAQLYNKLKELNPNIKALLSSGYSIEGQAQKIIARGCDGFIKKPYTIPKLSETIRAIMGKK